MEKNLGITKPLHSELILPITWLFVISKIYCRRIIAQSITSMLIPLGICRAFFILPVLTVGNLSENLCPEVVHLSIVLEEVNIAPLSIFHFKI